jgi:hypothetical protein
MTRVVLINERRDDIEEIELDLSPHINEAYKLLDGHPTFIGQWPEIDVVILKTEIGLIKNKNILPPPFDKEDVCGPVLLIRMDRDSEPQDFTIDEYMELLGGYESI